MIELGMALVCACRTPPQQHIVGALRSRGHRAALWIVAASFCAVLSAHAEPAAAGLSERLAEKIQAQAPNISAEAISAGINAYSQVRQRHLTEKPFVTIVDYSLPSAEKRLAVADVRTGKVLFYTYVAHGKGSGLKYATRFSNEPGSKTSSLGVYLTGQTYYGKHGYSLRLKGLNPEFNGAAYRRAIVIHGASYVSGMFARNNGRMGRSWGCFALSHEVESALVKRIREGTVLLAYYPDPRWLNSSPFLRTGPRDLDSTLSASAD